MQRISRLAEILKILHQKTSAFLNELEQHFKVSKRTIQRDIKTLREAGFPLKKIKMATIRWTKIYSKIVSFILMSLS
ncbi:HTH domain-containing protein [Desulfonauticus submarinus]